MTESIIIAIIGFLGAVVGSGLGILASAKLTNYRLEQLEKKVNLHNNVIERVYLLEKKKLYQNSTSKICSKRSNIKWDYTQNQTL